MLEIDAVCGAPCAHHGMAPIERFEDIQAWQSANQLDQALAKALEESPTFSDEALKDQMNRCTDSAMANIAEGFDAGSDPDFIRFLNYAYRSVTEFQSHLYPARNRGYLTPTVFDALYGLARDTKGLIGGFRRYLENSIATQPRPKPRPPRGPRGRPAER